MAELLKRLLPLSNNSTNPGPVWQSLKALDFELWVKLGTSERREHTPYLDLPRAPPVK